MKITQCQRNAFSRSRDLSEKEFLVDNELNELLYNDSEFEQLSTEEKRLTIEQLNSLLQHAFKLEGE